jgi:penicillin-binding protein 1C
MRDNWCIGYSNRYTVGVWIGNFTGEPMWNVSGITAAAPLWIEMMNFLHRSDLNQKPKPPVHMVKEKIEFQQGIESAREEWFIRGTEPDSKNRRVGQFNQRILYPPSGTVIALDPDIPFDQQKVFFISQTNEDGLRWKLNNVTMDMAGRTIAWPPRTGKYLLAIEDPEGRVIDAVNFEVRGPTEY